MAQDQSTVHVNRTLQHTLDRQLVVSTSLLDSHAFSIPSLAASRRRRG